MSVEHELNPAEHVTELEAAQAGDPAIGSGTAAARPGEPGAAPHEPPSTTLLERQPIRVVGAAQAIAAAATSIVALDAPWWAGLALGTGLYAAEEYKRLKVTPTAAPKLDADTPLTP